MQSKERVSIPLPKARVPTSPRPPTVRLQYVCMYVPMHLAIIISEPKPVIEEAKVATEVKSPAKSTDAALPQPKIGMV